MRFKCRFGKLGLGMLYDRTSFMHMEYNAMVDTLAFSLLP